MEDISLKGPGLKEKSLLWNNRYILFLLLFGAAASIKLSLFFSLSQPIVFFKYPFFADQINKGIDIGERILDLSPLYLYGMVLIQKIYGSNWEAMIVFQLLLGSINIIFIFLIGEKVFSRTVGIIAAVILMPYGNLILFEMTLEPDSFILFFNSLLVLVLLWAKEKSALNPSSSAWFLSGVILGMSVITKANALILLPAVIGWIFWTISGRKEKFQYSILILLGVSLMVLPVTLRNYVKFHDSVLVTADMGKVFFHGNGPGATGMERADLPDQGFTEERGGEPDFAHVMFRNTARKLSGRNLTPSQCSNYWTRVTLDYMGTHPYTALKLFLKKMIFFGLNYEVHDLDSNYAYYQTIRTWPLIPFGLISSLGILGMIIARKKFKQAYWPYIMVLVYGLTIIIFFNASRYRLPAVPFLSLFAAQAIAVVVDRFRNKKFNQGLFLIGTLVIFFILTMVSFKEEIGALDRWQQATRIHYNLRGNLLYFNKGEYEKAIDEYTKAIKLAPEFAPAYNQLGKSYALLNDLGKAEENFSKVIALSPNNDQGYMNLGFLYQLRGDIPKATVFFQKSHSLNPDNLKVQEQLRYLESIKKSIHAG